MEKEGRKGLKRRETTVVVPYYTQYEHCVREWYTCQPRAAPEPTWATWTVAWTGMNTTGLNEEDRCSMLQSLFLYCMNAHSFIQPRTAPTTLFAALPLPPPSSPSHPLLIPLAIQPRSPSQRLLCPPAPHVHSERPMRIKHCSKEHSSRLSFVQLSRWGTVDN